MLAFDMELRHLRYFVAVAEEENVTRAGLKLHLSQPALSRQIRDLENELGFPLLERSAKSIHLTEAGRVFLDEARAVLQRVDAAVTAARTAAAGGGEELHVGYATSPTVRILPPTLRAFQAEFPRVRIRLHDLSTEEMFAQLRSGALDLAFLVCSRPGMLRGLRFEELSRIPICLAVPPGHRLARRRPATLAEVAREPLVALSRKEYPDYHESLERVFAGKKMLPRIVEEHDSMSSLIAAVEAGRGVAIVSEWVKCISGPRLRFVRISPEPELLVVGAAWLKGTLSEAGRRLVDCAKKASKQNK